MAGLHWLREVARARSGLGNAGRGTPGTRAALLVLALAGAVAACGSDDDGAGPGGSVSLGTFSAQVSGAVTGSFSGMAAFGSLTEFGPLDQSAFALALEDDVGGRSIGIVKIPAGRPATGTHTIGEYLSELGGEFIVDGPTSTQFFLTGSGTLTITSSSAQSLQGSLSFSAQNEFGPGQVQVSATFNAICFPGAISCN